MIGAQIAPIRCKTFLMDTFMDSASPPDSTLLGDVHFWLTAGAILILLLLSALFSGSETALTAASRAKLRARADAGVARAARALRLTEDSERLIGSVLLGNNLVNILATSLATALFTRALGESGVAMATLVMTLLVLIFAEVLPKTYAITNPENAAERASGLMAPVVTLFSPVVMLVRALVRFILRMFGVRADPSSPVLAVREEIAGAISLGQEAGTLAKEERDRLLGALDLGDRTIEEIMRHRSEIEMIDADLPPRRILEKVLQSAHTRLPLYRENPENIIGVIHAKDLLRAMYARMRDLFASPPGEGKAKGGADPFENFSVVDVAMKPYFVPETTPLDDQMREFLRRQTHFALVVDEYGVLQGLITLEDILEEIVGEITDEFDESAEQEMHETAPGEWVVDGAVTVRDLNRAAEWDLPDEEANTVAGLVLHESQMIPEQGQVFSFHGYRFEVLERRANRIARLKVRRLE